MSLEVRQLRVRRGAELALDGVSFALQPGTLTALVGPNGAGKSTLLHAIEGQIPRESGSIDFDGNPLTPVLVRQQLALMPQRGDIAWHFPITVRELVSLGRLAAKRPGCCDVEAALQRVGLAAVAERRLDQLSGGQQQRALLARTLVQPARVLLLDEPCAAIDPPTRSELLNVMGQLRDAGLTLLVTSHDWGRDLDAYDRVLVLDRVLLADGTPNRCVNPSATCGRATTAVASSSGAPGRPGTTQRIPGCGTGVGSRRSDPHAGARRAWGSSPGARWHHSRRR